MKIIELEWVMQHWDELTPEEQERLDKMELRQQYKTGELSYKLPTMMGLMILIIGIYDAHNEGGEQS